MANSDFDFDCARRSVLVQAAVCSAPLIGLRAAWAANAEALVPGADRRWYDAAVGMQRLAESWGDQSYGAVLVLDGQIVGDGPSRVVLRGDANAHAEREAIRDAQRRLGRMKVPGSVLYSTSHPCRLCEAAAAAAQVSRMVYCDSLTDAGAPRR